MRWSPEDGEGGLRRVLLPRPLVRRKATIKSTHTMWYSSLVKPKHTPKAKRSFLITPPQGTPIGEANTNNHSPTPFPYNKAKDISRLQVIKSRTASTTKTRGAELDAMASSYLPRNSVIANQKE